MVRGLCMLWRGPRKGMVACERQSWRQRVNVVGVQAGSLHQVIKALGTLPPASGHLSTLSLSGQLSPAT